MVKKAKDKEKVSETPKAGYNLRGSGMNFALLVKGKAQVEKVKAPKKTREKKIIIKVPPKAQISKPKQIPAAKLTAIEKIKNQQTESKDPKVRPKKQGLLAQMKKNVPNCFVITKSVPSKNLDAKPQKIQSPVKIKKKDVPAPPEIKTAECMTKTVVPKLFIKIPPKPKFSDVQVVESSEGNKKQTFCENKPEAITFNVNHVQTDENSIPFATNNQQNLLPDKKPMPPNITKDLRDFRLPLCDKISDCSMTSDINFKGFPEKEAPNKSIIALKESYVNKYKASIANSLDSKPKMFIIRGSTPPPPPPPVIQRQIKVIPRRLTVHGFKPEPQKVSKETQTDLIIRSQDTRFLLHNEPENIVLAKGSVKVDWNEKIQNYCYYLQGFNLDFMKDTEKRLVDMQIRHQIVSYQTFNVPRVGDVFPMNILVKTNSLANQSFILSQDTKETKINIPFSQF